MPRTAAQDARATYERVWKIVSRGLPEVPIILAALIYTHANWLQHLVAPLAPFYPYAAVGAGVLIGWRFHRSRLLFALLLLTLADRTVLHFAVTQGLTRDRVVLQAIGALLPLNLAALSLSAERGVLTPPGLARLAFILGRRLAVRGALREPVRLAIRLDDRRVVDGDVGRPLVEVVHRIPTFAHHLGDERVRGRDGRRRRVDELGLNRLPTLGVALAGSRAERTDVELPAAPFPLGQLRFGLAPIRRVLDRPVVLGAELVPEVRRPPLRQHRSYRHREQQHGTERDENPTPQRHLRPPPSIWGGTGDEAA